MKKTLLTLITFVFFNIGAVHATTIGFSELGSNDIVGDYYSGVTFTNASVLEANLAGQDDINGIKSTSRGVLFTEADEITVVFDNELHFVSITGIDVGFNGIRLVAYDMSGALISEEIMFGTTLSGVGEFFTLSIAAAGIYSIAFSQVLDLAGDGVIFDNLVYNETFISSVPVPAAAWLFGSALFGFLGFSRRKANA